LVFTVPSGLASYSPVFTFLFRELGFALAAETRRAVCGAMRTGASRLVAARADDLQFCDLDRGLALEDAALLILLRIRAGVLLREVHSLDDRLSLGGIDAQNLALLAAVFPERTTTVSFLRTCGLTRLVCSFFCVGFPYIG